MNFYTFLAQVLGGKKRGNRIHRIPSTFIQFVQLGYDIINLKAPMILRKKEMIEF